MAKQNNCLTCDELQHHSTVFVKCKHSVNICNECLPKLGGKCPICRTKTDTISGIFSCH